MTTTQILGLVILGLAAASLLTLGYWYSARCAKRAGQ